MAIEKTTTQTFRAGGCELDLSFNRFKVADLANGEVIVIESLDWRKMQDAVQDYVSKEGSVKNKSTPCSLCHAPYQGGPMISFFVQH